MQNNALHGIYPAGNERLRYFVHRLSMVLHVTRSQIY